AGAVAGALAEHRDPDADHQWCSAPFTRRTYRAVYAGGELLRAEPPATRRHHPGAAVALAADEAAAPHRALDRQRNATEDRARLIDRLDREQPLGVLELDKEQRQRRASPL